MNVIKLGKYLLEKQRAKEAVTLDKSGRWSIFLKRGKSKEMGGSKTDKPTLKKSLKPVQCLLCKVP